MKNNSYKRHYGDREKSHINSILVIYGIIHFLTHEKCYIHFFLLLLNQITQTWLKTPKIYYLKYLLEVPQQSELKSKY